jgi:hypothetical protein
VADLDAKLQVKAGQTLAVVGAPEPLPVAAPPAGPADADAVLLYARTRADLDAHLPAAQAAAARGAVTWFAYPKAKQLGTDLNRDLLREAVLPHGLDTVRQVALDDTWSALRVKAAR